MKRILAVDDNKDILEILKYILEDSGYEVETLANGHDFFARIHEHTPDLVLLDVMLGDMDGRDICRNMKDKEETHDIPIIMISASHNAVSINQTCTPNAFLSKPFDISALLNMVDHELQRAA